MKTKEVKKTNINIKKDYTDNCSADITFCNESEQFKYNILHHDADLFDEEKYVVHPITELKRISNKKSERWEIKENGKIQFTLKAEQLTEKERSFLRTLDGFNLFLSSYKSGIKTISGIKNKIKEKLK